MKKALFHTFIAYVVLNIFLVYTDKEEYDEAYHAGIAEVVDFRNSKILKIQISGESFYFKHPYLHVYLFLKEGDKLNVKYKISAKSGQMAEVIINEPIRNQFTLDQIFIHLLLFSTMLIGVRIVSKRQSTMKNLF